LHRRTAHPLGTREASDGREHQIETPQRLSPAGRKLKNSYYALQSEQLLAGSFMDYAMPRADTLPLLATALSEIPAPSNRLGVRSGGEGGTTPALAAVINAIVDALAELGVRHIELPVTSEQVWRAIRAGDAAAVRSRSGAQ
jgi:hypothetical protein